MSLQIGRAVELYREGGLSELTDSIRRFYKYNIKPKWWPIRAKFSRDTQTVTLNGSTLEFRSETSEEIRRFKTLVGERPVLEDLLQSLGPDDIFWDVGANVGLYTCFASNEGSRVVAFEPGPGNLDRLRENLSRNAVEAMIFEGALGSESGTVELAREYNGAGGVHSVTHDSTEKNISVLTKRGDELIESGEFPAPTVLKIDVEGAEADVLNGLETALVYSAQTVYVEVHEDLLPKFNSEADEITSLLENAGFNIEILIRRYDTNYHIKATK